VDRTTQFTARRTAHLDPVHAAAPPSFSGHDESSRAAENGQVEAAVYDPARRAGPRSRALSEPLHVRAAQVLDSNWTGASTVPSHSLYPHQWSWDSAFIAIGLRHVSPLRAQSELETLLGAQWGDGRIPHIVFNPSVPLDAYFPSPDFWRSSTAGRAAGAPRTVQTSGIVQPPVHALAVWLVHAADPGLSRARSFLSRMYPRLAAWHRYLLHRRDLGGGGLASVVHPWEQGMDNAPSWDAPLSRVTPAPARSFRRADLDHGAAEDRPTDLDYGRYVRLAADYRDAGYADGAAGTAGATGTAGAAGTADFAGACGATGTAGTAGTGGAGGFAVEDPAFNALLIASEHALARIARELGATGTARHARAERLTAALVDRLWEPAQGMFFCRDVRTDELIPERGVSGLVPLILPTLPRETAATLVRTLRGPHFGLGDTTRLVPSYDLTGPAFDPHRYWRGPAWFNTNWLVERGLRLHGEHARARQLRGALLETADTSGFAEYVDPYTGEACGALGFSWTAALTLDLLHEAPTAHEAHEGHDVREAHDVHEAPETTHGTAHCTAEEFGEGAMGAMGAMGGKLR
jgi:hypothetical protein